MTTIDQSAAVDAGLPGYRDLYYRWEKETWEAGIVDLVIDRRQWTGELADDQRRSLRWLLGTLHVAEQRVTAAVVPFVDAATTEEQQVFLTTQLVDGARHTVFYDRFFEDAVREPDGSMFDRLGAQESFVADGFRALLDALEEIAERVREASDDPAALMEGVVLCHIVILGGVMRSFERVLVEHLAEAALLPGLREGLKAIEIDGHRHLAFGARFLRDAVETDRMAVEGALRASIPLVEAATSPPEEGLLVPLGRKPGDVARDVRAVIEQRALGLGFHL